MEGLPRIVFPGDLGQYLVDPHPTALLRTGGAGLTNARHHLLNQPIFHCRLNLRHGYEGNPEPCPTVDLLMLDPFLKAFASVAVTSVTPMSTKALWTG